MREAHRGKSWIPQNDAEEKQDLAEAQTITCDQFLHLLLTNYQQGTICYRQDNPDVERGIRTPGWKMTQSVTFSLSCRVFERTCWVNGRKVKVRERCSWLGIIRLTRSSASDFPTVLLRSCSIYILFDNSEMVRITWALVVLIWGFGSALCLPDPEWEPHLLKSLLCKKGDFPASDLGQPACLSQA